MKSSVTVLFSPAWPAEALSTSSFINALSRFLNRRGPVRQLRCGQGTNFVGAKNELKAALEKWIRTDYKSTWWKMVVSGYLTG